MVSDSFWWVDLKLEALRLYLLQQHTVSQPSHSPCSLLRSYFSMQSPSCCLREGMVVLIVCKRWRSHKWWEKQINGLFHFEVVGTVCRSGVSGPCKHKRDFPNRKPAMIQSKGWGNIDHGPNSALVTDWTTVTGVCLHILSLLSRQSQVVVTEITWHTDSKVFTIWPFASESVSIPGLHSVEERKRGFQQSLERFRRLPEGVCCCC